MARVERLDANRSRLIVGSLRLIVENKDIKELAYSACRAADMLAVEDEDMKVMVNAINSNMGFEEALNKAKFEDAKRKAIPLIGSTTNNNDFRGYTGSNIPIEVLAELNENYKLKNS